MTFEEARMTDRLIADGLDRGASLQEIIGAMASRHADVLKKLADLDSIRPRKITLDGKVMVWHCPDELIPTD